MSNLDFMPFVRKQQWGVIAPLMLCVAVPRI